MQTSTQHLNKASDAALVRLFQRGSNAAFNTLVNRHHKNLKNYSKRLLQNKMEVNDFLQNLWMDVVQRLRKKGYCEQGQFTNWLQTLAYRKAMETFRKKKWVADAPSLFMEQVSETSNADNDAYNEKIQQVRESINKMNAHIRQVIKMRIEEEMPFNEIAQHMHTSTGNVTAWYSRAVKRIAQITSR